jgi:hypothetical protein
MTLFLLFVAFVELLGLVYAFFSVYEILGCLCLAIELKVGMKVPMRGLSWARKCWSTRSMMWT